MFMMYFWHCNSNVYGSYTEECYSDAASFIPSRGEGEILLEVNIHSQHLRESWRFLEEGTA